jgi:hypothetical protein
MTMSELHCLALSSFLIEDLVWIEEDSTFQNQSICHFSTFSEYAQMVLNSRWMMLSNLDHKWLRNVIIFMLDCWISKLALKWLTTCVKAEFSELSLNWKCFQLEILLRELTNHWILSKREPENGRDPMLPRENWGNHWSFSIIRNPKERILVAASICERFDVFNLPRLRFESNMSIRGISLMTLYKI